MRPYFHLFRQEQPYVSHQNLQKVLILVLAQWYSNYYIIPELANKYSWWQVGSVPVSFTVYHKSKICRAFVYIQHRHMVCGQFHICHDLALYQNVNDNYYSTPLLHEVLDVEHKMAMMGIVWYQNIFSHLFVQHQHCPKHYTLCIYIFFYWLFSYIFPDQWLRVYNDPWTDVFGIIYPDWHHCFVCFSRLTSLFCVQEYIRICESNVFDPVSWTLDINWYI